MPYVKTDWQTGDVITAAKMLKIENQLEATTEAIEEAAVNSDGTSSSSLSSRINDMIIISETEPSSSSNEIWIKSTPTSTVVVPTDAEFQTMRHTVASEFDSTKAYALGDYVFHNGLLYRANATISANTAWNDNYWENVVLTEEILTGATEMKSYIDTVIENYEPYDIQFVTEAQLASSSFEKHEYTYYLVAKTSGTGYDKYWYIPDGKGGYMIDNWGGSSTLVVSSLDDVTTPDPGTDYIVNNSEGCLYYKYIDNEWQMVAGSLAKVVDTLPASGNSFTDYYVPNSDGTYQHYRWINTAFVAIGSNSYDKTETYTKAEISSLLGNYYTKTQTDSAISVVDDKVSTVESNISTINSTLNNYGTRIGAVEALDATVKASIGNISVGTNTAANSIDIEYNNGTTKTVTLKTESAEVVQSVTQDENDDSKLIITYTSGDEDTINLPAGGGSGTGGGGSVTLSRITDASIDCIYGDEDGVIIEYNFSALDSSGDTVGNGTGTWSVNNIPVVSNVVIAQGNGSFDIGPYLNPGNNNIKLTVSVEIGDSTQRATKTWTVNAVNMYFTWDYTDSQINTAAFTDYWTIYGDISKTTHTKIDNTELTPVLVSSRSNFQQSITIPMQTHGAHGIERWLSATINGTEQETAHQYHEAIFAVDGNTTPIIAISRQNFTMQQYNTVRIPVVVYNPASLLASATLSIDGTQIGSWENIDRSTQYWSYTPTEEGIHTLTITCGATSKSITATVVKSNLQAEEVSGYTFKLKASDLASNSALQKWSSNGVTASFSSGFDWINGGLKTETVDDNFRQYICIKAGDRMTINSNMFASDPRTNGITFKMIFKVVNCRNYDAVIMSNLAEDVGIQLTAHDGIIRSTGTSTRLQYAENDYIELEFDITPGATSPIEIEEDGVTKQYYYQYLMGWMDGVMSTFDTYDSSDTFTQTSGNRKPIVIGSDDCDVYVYLVKTYPRQLTVENHINNFIMDAPNATEMVTRDNRNNIVNSATGEIDATLLQTACPDLRVWLYDIPYLTNGKKDEVANCQFHQRWGSGSNSYQLDGVGVMTVQGTSSVNYIKGAANTDINLKSLTDGNGNDLMAGALVDKDKYGKNAFYSEDGSTVTIYEAAQGEELGPECVAVERYSDGSAKKYIKAVGLKISDSSCPITYSNTKVNFASCEQVNNMCNAIWYERYQPVPSLTARDCMEFAMGVQFIHDSAQLPDASHFQLFDDTTRYHLYSIANMGNSKKDVHVFHDLSNPLECCIENLDNTTAAQRMITADIGDWWAGKDFECRYPDTSNPSDAIKNGWKRLVAWMADRNPGAYTGAQLSTSETYAPYTFKGHDRAIPSEQGDHNWQQVLRGTTVSQYAGTYTHDTFERRMARMLSECEDYLIMDSMVYHFLFVERRTCVDNVTKNTFWSSTDCLHWDLTKSYDMDTSDGNNNNAEMVFDYGNEMNDVYRGSEPVFNGHDSVWFQFVGNLFEACQVMYQNREALGVWSATAYHSYLLSEQTKVPERVWNACYDYSYLRPFRQGIQAGWTKFLAEGKKTHQRDHFEYFQEKYFASKYLGSACTSDAIYMRVATPSDWAGVAPKAEISLKMYNTMYANVSAGAFNFKVKAERGVVKTIDFSEQIPSFSNTVVNVYSASMLQELSGLAQLYPTQATMGAGARLRSIEIGSSATGYHNDGLTSVTFTGNTMLEQLYVQNLTAISTSLDLSGCPALSYLDASGSTFAGITFATGGLIKEVHLEAPTALIMRDLTYLTDAKFDVADISVLRRLRLENCSGIDTLSLVRAATALTSVRLMGVDWEGTNALSDTTVLNRLLGLNGIDENNYDVTNEITTLNRHGGSILSGTAEVSGAIRSQEIDDYDSAWPQLEVLYDNSQVVTQYRVDYVNDDADHTLLYYTYVDSGSLPPNPVTAGNISTPTKDATAQYTYTYNSWKELNGTRTLSNVVTENITYVATYSPTVNTYTVTWYKRAGTQLLQKTGVAYGASLDYATEAVAAGLDAIPTDYDGESSLNYRLFTGWDKSTGYITGNTNVYAQWSTSGYISSSTLNSENGLDTLTPAQIYALTRMPKTDRIDLLSGHVKDYVDITMGHDFDFSNGTNPGNVQHTVLAENYLLNGTSSRIKVFDGTNGNPDIRLMSSVDTAWTLAIDFKFGSTTGYNTLLSCYDASNDSQTGIRLVYDSINNCPAVSWGASQLQKVGSYNGGQHFRDIVVLQHKAGSDTLIIYSGQHSTQNDKFGDTILIKEPRVTPFIESNIPLIIGGRQFANGNYGDLGTGMIYWAKLWYGDLGQYNCQALASWPHELVRFEYVGNGLYYHDSANGIQTGMSFFSNKLLEGRGFWMNTTSVNTGGWAESIMRKNLFKNRLEKAMPIWWQAMEVTSEIKSSIGSQKSDITTSNDYLYLASYRELSGSTNVPYSNESDYMIPWFSGGGTTNMYPSGNSKSANYSRIKFRGPIIFEDAKYMVSADNPYYLSTMPDLSTGDIWINTNNSAIGYYYISEEDIASNPLYYGLVFQTGDAYVCTDSEGNRDGGWVSATSWWERSPYIGRAASFMSVSNGGYAGNYYGASGTYGVCPGFSIGTQTNS